VSARSLPLLASRFSLLATLLVAPLHAQAPAGYSESITSTISSRTATAELVRTLTRETEYRVSRRADTTVVEAAAVRLVEEGPGGRVVFDTDGFTGGRWKLVPGPQGRLAVVDVPFVPPALVEVNDLAAAMDDFFPPVAPPLPVNQRVRDGAGRDWQRLPDSAAVRRYRWTATRTQDSTAVARDTITLRIEEATRELSELRLDARGAPLGWTREVVTEVTSRGGGRAVRATVRQRIVVRALP
jgi:hypothetical protein